jgi:hypothetical protein
MKNFKWLSLIAIVILISSCGKDLPELKGIQLSDWKTDRDGCHGIRAQSLDTLKSQKNLLLGLREMQIVEVLGKPDRNEPYKRNQKFFFYFLQPGESCDSTSESPAYLLVRFNAMGLAKEISVLN